MKKFVVTIIVSLGIVLAPLAHVEASTRVPAKKCASNWVINHPKSWTAKKCKRQGWYYERGMYPMYHSDTDSWTEIPYVLVYGPKGKLWVDTAGMYSSPNVR